MFEYNHVKNRANQEKHGISFKDAEALWDDVYLIIPAKTVDDEARHAVIGMIHGKCWVAIVQRKPRNIIRIISVRRARKKEEEYYEEYRVRCDI